RAGELRRDLRRPVAARLGNLGLDQLRHPPQQAQVGVDLVAHARAPDFQHHRRAVGEARAVHLRDRGRGVGARVDVAEYLEGRAAEGALELGQQLLERHRRYLGVQLLELLDPARRKEIDARGHDLAELDEGGAELLQRHAHAARLVEPGRVSGGAEVEHAPGALEQAGDADALHEIAQPVADEHRGDLMQARQLPHDAEGFAQHLALQSGLAQHGRGYGPGFARSRLSSASAMPASTPPASWAKRAPNSPASSSPPSVNSAIRRALRRPVSVPACAAWRTSSESSGRTRSFAERATCSTVATKSSSILRSPAAACLSSWSERPRPAAAIWRSASAPACTDAVSAWSMPRKPSARVWRTPRPLPSAPRLMPSVTERTTSRIVSRSKRRALSDSSVRSCTRPRMSPPCCADCVAASRISSFISPPW